MKKWLTTATVVFALTSSQFAFALISAQGLVGRRWYQEKSDVMPFNFNGNAITLAAHVDPIPLVPVAAGLSLTSVEIPEGAISRKSSIAELGLDIVAWVPMVPYITPYGKLTYDLVSKIKYGSDTYDISGYQLHVGFKRTIIPLFSLLVDAGMGFEKIKWSSRTEKLDSKSILLGLEFGF